MIPNLTDESPCKPPLGAKRNNPARFQRLWIASSLRSSQRRQRHELLSTRFGMTPRSHQFYATALVGGALAALLAPGMAQAAECGASFQQSATKNLPGFPQPLTFTFTFPGFTTGLASAIGAAVTTTDAVLKAQGSSAFVVATPTQAPDQQGGGVWARGVGGNFLTSVPVTGSSGLSAPFAVGGLTAASPIDCQSRVREEFNGVQVGADVARLNFGGTDGTFHFGLTSGQVETSALTNSASTNLDFRVPFFGLYASLTYGNFFADAQIRGNFLEGSLTDNQNSVFGNRINGRGFTVSSNIGYNYKLPGDWFIEPSAGVNWSRTFVDPVNVSTINTITSAVPPAPPVPASLLNLSNVRIQDFDNLTGRASVRVGTTFPYGQYIFQPFATASVFHEFASPISSQVNTLGVASNSAFILQQGPFSTDRIGTYAQFGLGVTGQIADSGLTGYVRGDYLTGSRFEGWSVVGGARYDFNPEAGAVVQGRSADVAGAPYAPPPYNWTGFFLGASAPGALWGDTNWSSANTRAGGEAKVAGLLAGGGGGYNYQLGPLVIGGLVEWDWSHAQGGNSFSCPGDFGGFAFTTFTTVNSLSSFSCEARVNSIFTATARVGYAFDRLLIYGQGGLAAGDISAKTVTTVTTLQTLVPTPLSVVSVPTTASASKTSVGWTIGAGFEYGLTQNISAKAEYLFFNLGSDTYNLGVPVSINRTGNIGRVGLNYRFNWM